MTNKPRVEYLDLAPPLVVGHSARLILANRRWYRTSKVVDVTYTTRGPIVETQNTFYWPGPTDESQPLPSVPPVAVPLHGIAVNIPSQYQR